MAPRQTILIIEDSPTAQAYLCAHLQDEPVDITVAEDGESGIERARTLLPDLILLDVKMRGVDGFEVCRRLKNETTTHDIPVVFLTGASSTERKIQGLELGAVDYITKPFDPAELRARVRGALRTKYLTDLLAKKAQMDALTQLWNRAHLDQQFVASVSFAHRHGLPLSCIMLDVDHFKSINDRYGHSCGDAVLRLLADVLRLQCRVEDVVCRYGGEEFVILAPGTSAEQAATLAERIRVATAASVYTHAGQNISFTCSFGVAELASDPNQLLQRADECLYQSKLTGRNRVTVAPPALAA